MPYCISADVEGYFLGKTFDCEDYLTSQEVKSFIAQDAAHIDAVLKTRYSLPISDATDLLILKSINEKMVVGTIDDLFREKTEDGKFDRRRNTRKEALEMLKQLKEGSLLLDGTEKESVIFYNKNDGDGNEVEKRFKDKDTEPTNETISKERRTIIRVS